MSDFINLDSQSLFHQFFLSGGPIVWFVLLPMSVGMLYLGIDLGLRLRRRRVLPPGRSKEIATLAARYGLGGLAARLSDREDLISRAAARAVEKNRRRGFDRELLLQSASDSLREQGLDLLRRAERCHLIGTVAPMVGLFGTVYGMIEAFTVLALASGQPRPDQLAAAIAVALVTTFWGLLIAIPALFLHGFFRTRIEVLISQAACETELLLDRLLEIARLDGDASRASHTAISNGTADSAAAEPLELESGTGE
jgi:biopolymer transport protein ExbB